MAYYNECELCGSNLDPCERCACMKGEEESDMLANELYDSTGQRTKPEEIKTPYETCNECGGHIHYETESLEQDECFEIEGKWICGDCIMEYLRENYSKQLSVGL